jgi:serine/threonine protein kinase
MFLPFYQYGDLYNYNEQLRRSTISIKLHVMKLMAESVKKCHELGYLHLDIKLDNFFVDITPDGKNVNILLADFGGAQDMRTIQISEGPDVSESDKKYWFGTLFYMAPEMYSRIVDGRQVYKKFTPNVKIDVYALGKTFLTFFNETVGYVPRPDLNDELPVALKKLIGRSAFPLDEIFKLIKNMIENEPAERTFSLNDIIKEINRIMEEYIERVPFVNRDFITDLVQIIKNNAPKLNSFKKKYLKYKKKYIELKKLKFIKK